jgi:hypothetical protein
MNVTNRIMSSILRKVKNQAFTNAYILSFSNN